VEPKLNTRAVYTAEKKQRPLTINVHYELPN
jgi:hypothetical protein